MCSVSTPKLPEPPPPPAPPAPPPAPTAAPAAKPEGFTDTRLKGARLGLSQLRIRRQINLPR